MQAPAAKGLLCLHPLPSTMARVTIIGLAVNSILSRAGPSGQGSEKLNLGPWATALLIQFNFGLYSLYTLLIQFNFGL